MSTSLFRESGEEEKKARGFVNASSGGSGEREFFLRREVGRWCLGMGSACEGNRHSRRALRRRKKEREGERKVRVGEEGGERREKLG